MRKNMFVIVLLLSVVLTGSLTAASVGSIGLVNYASWYEVGSEDTDAYVPGIRGEFFFSDILGISADALMLAEWTDAYDQTSYLMMYIIDIMARAPLGLLEPYVGLGPVYLGYITEDDSSTGEDSVGFNLRGGLDLNIFDWLSVGAEANYFVDDLEDFFDNTDYYFSEQGLKESALIGLSAKFKF